MFPLITRSFKTVEKSGHTIAEKCDIQGSHLPPNTGKTVTSGHSVGGVYRNVDKNGVSYTT